MSQSASQARTILQINTRDRRGGAEQCAWGLFDAYREHGLDSWLAVNPTISHNGRV